MASITSIKSLVLDLPPCCVAFCPSNPEYAVIGTYNLEQDEGTKPAEDVEGGGKKSQERNGSLVLIKVVDEDVKIVQTLPTPSAILDVHFQNKRNSNVFAAATSTGSISIYSLISSADQSPTIQHTQTIHYATEDLLVTASAWSPDDGYFGMTLSSGHVRIGKIPLSSETDTLSGAKVGLHDLEAWTLAFLPDGSGMLSGGDDCALKFAELSKSPIETLNDSEDEADWFACRRTPWTDKKIHGAGVTAILPVYQDDDRVLIFTGSYDDHIRLLEATTTGRRRVLAVSNLGGGVWRLKVLRRIPAAELSSDGAPMLQPYPQELVLLVSCMYAGTRIIKFYQGSNEDWQFEVLAKFEEHKSMNYGSDCQPSNVSEAQRTFVTTSFYDRLLCLWRF